MAKKQSEDTVTITVTEDALSVTINDDPSVPAFTLNLDLFGQVRSDVRVASDKERNGVTPSVRDSYVVAAPLLIPLSCLQMGYNCTVHGLVRPVMPHLTPTPSLCCSALRIYHAFPDTT